MPTPPAADSRRPVLSLARAAELAALHYGLEAEAKDLPSERDRTLRLRLADGGSRVLRLSSPDQPPAEIELQNAALQALSGLRGVPRLVPTRDGAGSVTVEDEAGALCILRVLTWLPGRPLAQVKPVTAALWRGAGRLLGEVDRALAAVDHPAADRWLDWDLARAGEVLADRLQWVPAAYQPLVESALARWQEGVAPLLPSLPRQILHNDGNDWNLLVEDGLSADGEPSVSGLIDFGDMVRSARVHEVAIAAAYASFGRPRPQGMAAAVLAGYHAVLPLGEDEVALLPRLIAARLATSVATSAWRRALGLSDPYLSVSEEQAWAALAAWLELPEALAVAELRLAAGWDAHPHRAAVLTALAATPAAPVIDVDLRREPSARLDLSVASADLAELDDEHDPHALDALCRRLEREAGARVAAGGYGEARPVYLSPAFAVPGSERRERRTIHLGVDLFQPAGRPVFAPLDGVVHSFADNAAAGDYGPTLILEHKLGYSAGTCYTLYGHLARTSLAGREVGQEVARGERIGELGDVHENGGWAPHLHFQLLLDPLGNAGDFPGVAAPSESAAWLGLCPDPNVLLGIPTPASGNRLAPVGRADDALSGKRLAPVGVGELTARRRAFLGHNLSLSYREPLHIVRGRGAYLIDHRGHAYLDTVNNVACVGHCHPDVQRALRRQMALLNTNTRYLHAGVLRYAERLASTLPDPLSVCFFVNSGSEANDLALRLARAHSGAEGVLVVDGAYHGHTQSLIEISPYKFDGRGGRGRPPHVRVLPSPDPYRRPERDDAGDIAAALASLEGARLRPAAFFCESVVSCGGQIVLPPGYLTEAYAQVRACGGVCVADEVQTGFARSGDAFWAFERHGVTPDIVTLGKPIGNGHPLAAVLTTPEIAASFANGMEYFNTFGGNAVSCAVGEAVLDVIEAEGLQAHALTVGNQLLAGLEKLAGRHALIGDVRGAGLFLGVELVDDRATRAPAGRQTSYVLERMKERGILMSSDGPHHNVLKIKPPLVFSAADADLLLDVLDQTLGEDRAQPRKSS